MIDIRREWKFENISSKYDFFYANTTYLYI